MLQCGWLFLCRWVVQHKMIWIVIGMMVYWSIFTENKAVIYVKTVQICYSISHPTFHISKNLSVTRCSIWCRLTNFSLNFKNPNCKSTKWILVMLSITVTCCRNIHIHTVEISWLYLSWFRRKMNFKTTTWNTPGRPQANSLYHICKEKSRKFELISVSREALIAAIVWKF